MSSAIALGLLIALGRLRHRDARALVRRTSRDVDRRSGLSASLSAAGVRRAVPGVHRGAVDRGRPAVPRARRAAPMLEEPEGGWPGVTVLIPAYNEESVIADVIGRRSPPTTPRSRCSCSTTARPTTPKPPRSRLPPGDPRCRVLRDPVNRGKAEQLNAGFREARYALVAVIGRRHARAPRGAQAAGREHGAVALVAAVAGAPHVTNRGG